MPEEEVEAYARRVEKHQPGDLALYSFGRTVSHSGIILGDDLMIHAERQSRCVTLSDLRSIAHRFHSYWSVF